MASATAANKPVDTVNENTLSSNIVSDWIYDFLFNKDISNKFLYKHQEVIVAIVLFYVLFVKWIGPYLMRNRKPYDLKTSMIVYNFMNVASNMFICWIMCSTILDNWNIRCGVRTHNHAVDTIEKIRPTGWLWVMNKIFDLLDTVFFVLRKKYNQVTHLHVIHHAGVILICLLVFKYNAFSYYLGITLCLNCFIHVVMYSYYALAAFGPHMQKYLWWKKYMTQMQIVQFVIILGYMAHSFATGCELMDSYELTVFFFIALNLVMFLNFYRKSYKLHRS